MTQTVTVSDPVIPPHDDDMVDVWFWRVFCPEHNFQAIPSLEDEHMVILHKTGVLEKYLEWERKYVEQRFREEAGCDHEIPTFPLPASVR